MILCHKCSGTFEQHPSLYGCRCISGYPRGFEPTLTEAQALHVQIKELENDLKLYRGQGRDETGHHIQETLAEIARLSAL